ncbi:MAG: ferritin-like domain-containing protein [Nostocales cyanobacterium]|nr:MAG: ferritin-like domain-containing protein [Nostocales cyanobacterium]TAF07782.1 MAG: ferritin-like domain-containing protein [Nostocales cyanobacterium]
MVQLSERPGVKKISSLSDKFNYAVCMVYDAETRFLEAQQMMVQYCQNQQLKSILETHTRETEQQVRNLEQVFQTLGQEPQRITCDAAVGLISDWQKSMLLTADNQELIQAGIAGGQLIIENLEIAFYHCLIKGAEKLGESQAVQLLQQNLEQEEKMSKKLDPLISQMLTEMKSSTVKSTAKSR